uniref:Uncharacterized protein n=1 Tax=Eutreptiella gymnastica TaxID=73025 RepID=A0A7S4G320_9EUGL
MVNMLSNVGFSNGLPFVTSSFCTSLMAMQVGGMLVIVFLWDPFRQSCTNFFNRKASIVKAIFAVDACCCPERFFSSKTLRSLEGQPLPPPQVSTCLAIHANIPRSAHWPNNSSLGSEPSP